jgi:mismatch-specific thymine-DNA glycosylase
MQPCRICYLLTVGPLRDILRPGLEIIFVGINPGRHSAAAGHHYAGPGNAFWPLLSASGLVGERLTADSERCVLDWGIGLTNMVARPSTGIADLSTDELRAGARSLRRRLLRFRSDIVCFNGKRIYEIFAGRACRVGRQAERIGRSRVFVMPSTSPRGASYSKAQKLAYFRELVAMRDELRRQAAAS